MAKRTAAIQADARIERLITAARDAGMPREQIEGFIARGYVPLPQMLPFHAAARQADRIGGPDEIALGGTRGPGKSHAVFAQVALDDCQRIPGLKILFLRKVLKAASEAFEDLVVKVLAYTPHDRKLGQVSFPNGSRILIGGYRVEADIEKYLGIEYDAVAIEEATQLSERTRQAIGGSVRSTKPGWRPRKYYTSNPAGIGLKWFKRDFVLPWRAGTEKFTRYFHGEYKGNPFLDEGYIRYLNGLTGSLAKAWRLADWDAFEGMAISEWNYDRHTCDPFEIPDYWPRWRAVDWGYANPWCCLWLAKQPDIERIYVYREAYATQLTDPQQAQRILDMTPPAENILFTFADPSMWASKTQSETVTTTADVYARLGVPLTRADNHRMNGNRKLHNLMADLPDGEPGLVIFRTCSNLIRTLPDLPSDERNPEDVDTAAEDHGYDALRYGFTNIRIKAELPPEYRAQPARNPMLQAGGFF